MKTHSLMIAALVLTSFAGTSPAATDTDPKPTPAPPLAAAPETAKEAAPALEAVAKPAKAQTEQAASKQPLQDLVAAENKAGAKPVEAGTDKAHKAIKHSAEKAEEKTQ